MKSVKLIFNNSISQLFLNSRKVAKTQRRIQSFYETRSSGLYITYNFKSELQIIAIFLVLLILFGFTSSVVAAPIQERVRQFPQWDSKPPVQLAKGDLEYPEWMAGTWNVKSTLIEKVAPLAPDLVSPGFKDNDNYIDKAIAFQVRFGTEFFSPNRGFFSIFNSSQPAVVADRAFNGKKIAQAYLGEDNVYRVKTDPDNPNQQITILRGERKLF